MKQELNLAQTPKLSQKMIQSLEILQMSSQELEAFLKEKELENPLFDLERTAQEPKEKSDLQRKLEWIARGDEQNRVYYREDHEEYEKEAAVWAPENGLAGYVLSQLISCFKTKQDEEIYEFLAYNLDDKGYLKDMPECLMEVFELSEDQAKEYLEEVKRCDPAGVGAENLKECLLIQLDRKQIGDETEKIIAEDYLEELGKNQVPRIAKAMGISVGRAAEACRRIKELNPKPSQGFSSRNNLRYLLPDVTVVKFKDYFDILLDENNQYTGQISPYYLDMMKQDHSAEVKEYLEDKYRQAQWIFQCISTRKETLMKVCKGLVENQREFFEKGPGHLRPLTMAALASQIQVHESTISRAVRDKYLQCAWGIYPLNYFFARSIKEQGEHNTLQKLKSSLHKMIEQEDKKHPLSDQKLADKLNEMGIAVSRRTIAKYRTQMQIPDAGGRKQY